MRSTRRLLVSLGLIAIATTGCAGNGGASASGSASASASDSASASASASAAAATSPAASASASGSEAEASCDPACDLMRIQPPNLTEPGKIPAGTYNTQNFYPGSLSVTLDDHWSSREDSTGEFNLHSDRNAKGDGDELLFWLDMRPVTYDGKPVTGIGYTPEAVSEWLHGLSWLSVTPAKATTIGQDHLPALTMDINIAKDAPNGDPGCPTRACASVFTFPEFNEPWAMADDMTVRIYLAQIGDGPHMLYLVFNVVDSDAFAPIAQPVIDSIKLSTDLK